MTARDLKQAGRVAEGEETDQRSGQNGYRERRCDEHAASTRDTLALEAGRWSGKPSGKSAGDLCCGDEDVATDAPAPMSSASLNKSMATAKTAHALAPPARPPGALGRGALRAIDEVEVRSARNKGADRHPPRRSWLTRAETRPCSTSCPCVRSSEPCCALSWSERASS